MIKPVLFAATITTCLISSHLHAEGLRSEITGSVASELRIFPNDALFADQKDTANISFTGELEYYTEWNDGLNSFTFTPFVRIDNHDSERTHADIRELHWQTVADDWELRIGLSKVFWGVTESVHLVDIINQTDMVENTDGEDKLGQAMVNLTWINDYGIWDFFMLPGFRERTFPGKEGRLRTQPIVDVDNPRFEADNGRGHIDWAARWTHTFGDWDVGIAHFYGTSREPTLLPGVDANSKPVLTPFYPIINQTSLDAQLTTNEWLWKLEWISRDGHGDRYSAVAGGFEYTFVGIMESAADLGLITEFIFDDRAEDTSNLLQHDVMIGTRFTLNDVQSTELLFGIIEDLDNDQRSYSLEASRRLGDHWKLVLESRLNSGIKATDTFGSLRDDDYFLAELTRYF